MDRIRWTAVPDPGPGTIMITKMNYWLSTVQGVDRAVECAMGHARVVMHISTKYYCA